MDIDSRYAVAGIDAQTRAAAAAEQRAFTTAENEKDRAARMEQARVTAGIGPKDIDIAVSRDPRVTAAEAAVGKVINPKDRPAAEAKLAEIMATVRKEKIREFGGSPAAPTPSGSTIKFDAQGNRVQQG